MTTKTFFFPKRKIRYMGYWGFFSRMKEEDIQHIEDLVDEFNFYNRKYAGLNFFASFCGKGRAYEARKALSDHIEKIWAHFETVNTRGNHCRELANIIVKNNKLPWMIILINFPVILLFCEYNTMTKSIHCRSLEAIYQNVIHIIINPIQLVIMTIVFIQFFLLRIFEIGSTPNEESHFLFMLLKGVILLPFVIIYPFISLLNWVANLPFRFIYQPLEFFVLSLVQFFNESGKEEMHWDIAHATAAMDEFYGPSSSGALELTPQPSTMNNIAEHPYSEDEQQEQAHLLSSSIEQQKIEGLASHVNLISRFHPNKNKYLFFTVRKEFADLVFRPYISKIAEDQLPEELQPGASESTSCCC